MKKEEIEKALEESGICAEVCGDIGSLEISTWSNLGENLIIDTDGTTPIGIAEEIEVMAESFDRNEHIDMLLGLPDGFSLSTAYDIFVDDDRYEYEQDFPDFVKENFLLEVKPIRGCPSSIFALLEDAEGIPEKYRAIAAAIRNIAA